MVEQEQAERLGRRQGRGRGLIPSPSVAGNLRARAGRTGLGPLLVAVPVFFATLLVLWLLPRAGTEWGIFEEVDESRVPDLDGPAPTEVKGWVGELPLDGGARLEARLSPLHSLAGRNAFQADVLPKHLGLGEGTPWRLELRFHPAVAAGATAPAPVSLVGLAVRDAAGPALAPLLAATTPPAEGEVVDPLRTLYALPAGPLAAGEAVQVALWGRAPGEDPRLLLAEGALAIELAPAVFAAPELPRSFASVARPEVHVAALPSGEAGGGVAVASADEVAPREDPREARIAELTALLEAERQSRAEREFAWHQYNRALADLDIARFVGEFAVAEEFHPDEPEATGPDGAEENAKESDPEADPDAGADVGARRANAIHVSLKNLLRMEEVFGLDLLEPGTLGPRGIGPAIFRTLDDWGRLTGSIQADVLRLEGSRAARTLTLVLEGGFESRGGERVPFEGGVRRIVFPFVDPEPWMAELPELFSASDLRPDLDDGRWAKEPLRRELNRLLALDSSMGVYRVWGIGGVLGDRLVDVQIEHFDADGRLIERLFADRVKILLETPGVLLLLEGGASMRGNKKTAFLEGKHRIFLPRAPADEWRAASLPGGSDAATDGLDNTAGTTTEGG